MSILEIVIIIFLCFIAVFSFMQLVAFNIPDVVDKYLRPRYADVAIKLLPDDMVEELCKEYEAKFTSSTNKSTYTNVILYRLRWWKDCGRRGRLREAAFSEHRLRMYKTLDDLATSGYTPAAKADLDRAVASIGKVAAIEYLRRKK